MSVPLTPCDVWQLLHATPPCPRPIHQLACLQALVANEMCRVYGVDSVEAVVPVFNTNTLDVAAAKYWQLAGQFEGESCEGM